MDVLPGVGGFQVRQRNIKFLRELVGRVGDRQFETVRARNKKFQTKDNPSKFVEWVKKLDPDGWEWEFREEKGKRGKYFPIKPLA